MYIITKVHNFQHQISYTFGYTEITGQNQKNTMPSINKGDYVLGNIERDVRYVEQAGERERDG